MKSDELDLDLEERRILRDGYGGLEPPSAKKDFILGALSVRLPGALGPAPPESNELDPPQNVKISAIGAKATHASHLRPWRPSRIRCSIACPEQVGPEKIGGADGTRTRDPRRDRPVF